MKINSLVHRKPIFGGALTNFESLIHISYNCSLIVTLLNKAFKLCSNSELFHREIEI